MFPETANGTVDSTAAPPGIRPMRKFYVEHPYGSDLQFNPMTVVVNEGYDMLRIITEDRPIGDIPYSGSVGSLWRSIMHPDRAVSAYGWNRWVRTELLPLSLKGQRGGQWEPNYHLHLFGAGMTYARLAEWYDKQDMPHPRIASAVTLFAGHFLNEVVENARNPTPYDEDGLTDLLIFDPAGMLLWNTSWMRRAFSGSWEINNWYGQPTWVPRTHRLENVFSGFYVRAPLPRTDDWKLFTLNGNAFLAGLSRRVGDSLMISVGGGAAAVDVPVIDAKTNTKTVALAPNYGVFLDRNGSLLVSFIAQAGRTNGPTLNIYPGVLKIGPLTAGLWVQSVHGGFDNRGVRWGITSTLGPGVGMISR